MVADMVAFVASQFTTSTWDVGAQELCSVVLISNFYNVLILQHECLTDHVAALDAEDDVAIKP